MDEAFDCMKTVHKSVLIWFSADEMFSLVTDVNRYPQFLPWCDQASVLSHEEQTMTARVGISFGGIRQSFTTRNTLEPDRAVVMRLERGPFRTLEGEWTLQPMGDVGCTVTLRLRFEFDSRLTGMMLTPVIEQTASSLVDAFVARAREINARESGGGDVGGGD